MSKVAWLFPGQGSQAVGMGTALAQAETAAKAVLQDADAALGSRKMARFWAADILRASPPFFNCSIRELISSWPVANGLDNLPCRLMPATSRNRSN